MGLFVSLLLCRILFGLVDLVVALLVGLVHGDFWIYLRLSWFILCCLALLGLRFGELVVCYWFCLVFSVCVTLDFE